MAQDARDSRSQPTDSSVCDEKELETQGSPQGLPHSASNSDTQPPGPGRNSTSVPSGNASRRPDGLHIDENGNYRYIKPKLRTLPGIHSPTTDRGSYEADIYRCSVDPISRLYRGRART